MARLLFLGASISQLPSMRYAHERGHTVVAVDGDPAAVGFAVADHFDQVDFSDVDAVTEVARRRSVEAVLAVSSDRAVYPAAAVAEALGLPGIGVEVATRMTDKVAMRGALRAAGVSQPAFQEVGSPEELLAAAAAAGYPLVLKPADSGGQRGVFRAESAEDALRFFPEARAASRTRRVLVEEYRDGTELNGIVVMRRGEPTLVTLSDRLRPNGRGFAVGWIHRFPSSLPPELLAETGRVACRAVQALGLRDGIGFPQLIASERDGVSVVEVAARIPAGQMADLVAYATGIDLFDVAIRTALGQPVPDELITPVGLRPIVIRFLTADPGHLPVGVVTRIDGLDDVRASAGVLKAELYFDVGERIRPVQVDADRRGFIVATGVDSAAALSSADEAAGRLVVETAAARGGRVARDGSRPAAVPVAPPA